MRVIIAGSRTCTNYSSLLRAVERAGFEITSIISGGAKGADALGIQYARQHNIPYRVMNALWDKHGKSAGYMRNARMAAVADALIVVWDGKSAGTRNMLDIAKRKKLKIYTLLDE